MYSSCVWYQQYLRMQCNIRSNVFYKKIQTSEIRSIRKNTVKRHGSDFANTWTVETGSIPIDLDNIADNRDLDAFEGQWVYDELAISNIDTAANFSGAHTRSGAIFTYNPWFFCSGSLEIGGDYQWDKVRSTLEYFTDTFKLESIQLVFDSAVHDYRL